MSTLRRLIRASLRSDDDRLAADESESMMLATPQGALAQMAFRLDALIQSKVCVGLDDMGADEVDALLILNEERAIFQNEKAGDGKPKIDLAKLQSIPRTS